MIIVLQNILIAFIIAFSFRVRGGFGEKWDWKMPLCKWWFCVSWTLTCVYLMPDVDWTSWLFWNKILCILIGARLSTNITGWGEAITCALGLRKPDPAELHCLPFDKFCDNFGWDAKDITLLKISHNKKVYINWVLHLPEFHLIDHAELYGIVWLTCRGTLLTLMIALPMNSLLVILWGAPMGVIYWFAGWLYRHGVNDGKGGWRTAEWLYGAWLGLGLCLFG